MLRKLYWFLKRGFYYQPLNKVIVSKANLLSNFQYLSRVNHKVKIAPVLKSNAYGHGIVGIARILDPLSCPFFCVDSIFEAYQLLRAKIKTPILIMGYIDPNNLRIKHLPFQYAISNLELAKALDSYQRGAKVHVFVDTGMNREGIRLDELENFLRKLLECKNLRIVGLMSHFASANRKENAQTTLQIKNFQKALKILKSLKINPPYKHISASVGLFTTKNDLCNVARVGKALYGIDPLDQYNPKLTPVLKFTSRLAQIKPLKKGSLVGYMGTYKAPKDMVMGILPLGYNDGMDRRLSNKGEVELRGTLCKIIGMISMNVTAIDLTDVKAPQVGDEVVIFSDQQMAPNSIINIAKLCGTTPYDIMVNLVTTTRRVVLDLVN